jgi:radical SAM protein with 4Fe4S-binding SPASM domain
VIFFKNLESKRYLKYLYDNKEVPFISHVYIETTDFCNKKCDFCPTGKGIGVENITITDKQFTKVKNFLLPLKDKPYIRISLYGHNEPLTDTKIISRLKKIRKILPDNLIYISTNGVLLENYIDDIKNNTLLDRLMINCYDEECYNNVINILKNNELYYIENYEYNSINGKINKELEILVFKRFDLSFNFTYNNKGNNIFIPRQNKNLRIDPCSSMFFDIFISINGDIFPCCYECSRKYPIDNISNYKDINEYLESNKYKEFVEKMLQEPYNISPCNKCNFDPSSKFINYKEIYDEVNKKD